MPSSLLLSVTSNKGSNNDQISLGGGGYQVFPSPSFVCFENIKGVSDKTGKTEENWVAPQWVEYNFTIKNMLKSKKYECHIKCMNHKI